MIFDPWYLLQSGAGLPAANMAYDEALLEFVGTFGHPVLRFYSWLHPSATFGYFQHFRDVEQWTQLRPLIRRPTGGGLVPHDGDWTYGLVFPPDHAWYQLRAAESYAQVHQWIHRAFQALGVRTQLAATPEKGTPGQCFLGAERFDVLREGVKVAGAAQRRNRQGLLIQGSIQPRDAGVSREQWEERMLCTAAFPNGVVWRPLSVPLAMADRVEQLAAQKYASPAYNQRR